MDAQMLELRVPLHALNRNFLIVWSSPPVFQV